MKALTEPLASQLNPIWIVDEDLASGVNSGAGSSDAAASKNSGTEQQVGRV